MQRKNRGAVIWSPAAANDIRDIWRYFSRAVSPEFADRSIAEIQFVIDRLEIDPRLGRERLELGRPVRSFPVPPYVVFFEPKFSMQFPEDTAEIEILRVMHERRDVQRSAVHRDHS